MPGVELTPLGDATHADGVCHGGGAGCHDDAESVFHPPSFAPSDASGMPGDLDDLE